MENTILTKNAILPVACGIIVNEKYFAMKKNIKIEKYLFIISGIVILLGFLYDVYFAGIPYQDPPPEILESYELHNFVATTITKTRTLNEITNFLTT